MSEYLYGKPLRTELPSDLHRIALGNGVEEDQNVLWPVFKQWILSEGIDADTLNGYTFEELQSLWVAYADTKDIAISSNTSRISELENNQTIGYEVYSNYEDRSDGRSFLPPVGVVNVSYKVADDAVDSSLNGYYRYENGDYQPDASLANGVIEDGNVEAVEGGKIYSEIIGFKDSSNKEISLEQGAISSENGVESSNNARVRSVEYFYGNIRIKTNSNYQVRQVSIYDENKLWVGNAQLGTNPRDVYVGNKGGYSRIIFNNNSLTDFLPTEDIISEFENYQSFIDSKKTNDITNETISNNINLEQGTISSTTGGESENSSRVRAVEYFLGSFNIKTNNGYKVRQVSLYDKDKLWVGNAQLGTDLTNVFINNKEGYSRIVFNNDSLTDILPTEDIVDDFENYLDINNIKAIDKSYERKFEYWKIGEVSSRTYGVIEYFLDRAASWYWPCKVGDIIKNYDPEQYEMNVFKMDNEYNRIEEVQNKSLFRVDEDCIIRLEVLRQDRVDFTEQDLINVANNCLVTSIDSVSNESKIEFVQQKVPIKTSGNILKTIPYPAGVGATSDFCVVGSQLWQFETSADGDDLDFATVTKMELDIDAGTLVTVGTTTHNFGHANSVNYNPTHNALIQGNGSGDYFLEGEIIITENALTTEPLSRASSIVIDCSIAALGFDLGAKVNVVWGDSNYGEADIAYMFTNDGGRLRKIQLGRGTDDLGLGVIIPNALGFNGTFKILEEQSQGDHGYYSVVQGADYYKGKILCGYGHNEGGAAFRTFEMESDNVDIYTTIIAKYLNDGNADTSTNNALAVKDDYLLAGLLSGTNNGVVVIKL